MRDVKYKYMNMWLFTYTLRVSFFKICVILVTLEHSIVMESIRLMSPV